jgi:wyosine [tRNA(Phe)-imidazoG37] synthetase (radical SAM superfamily)
MTIALQAGLTYGPVASRRFGRSLGVNVLPAGQKACNLNCPYCQYGWTDHQWITHVGAAWPAPASIAAAVERALRAEAGVDCLTLAGNGEPTLHPRFPEIVDRLVEVRGRVAPRARLAVLSNSSTLANPWVRAGLAKVDDCCMKFDAGDDETARRMNGHGVRVAEIVEGLAGLPGVVLQSMFTRDHEGRIDNTTERALGTWVEGVRAIRPTAVHVYTLDRGPAYRKLRGVPRTELEAIAGRVRAIGVAAQVF